MALIKAESLTIGYGDDLLVEDLSFEINAGEQLCIVGENGSGKSTLMRTVLRQIKPISGRISYSDGLKPTHIGYLPQQTKVQKDFPASVEEVVLSGCTARLGRRFFMGRGERLEAMQNMKMMNVYDLAKRSYSTLSGGQMQRVLLARALCAANKVLILDEPVSGLDPNASADMYETIHHLNKHTGITIIMVTHDIDNALRDATKVLKISKEPTLYTSVEEYKLSLSGGAV